MKTRRRAAFCLILQILIILGEIRAIALSANGYRAFVYAYYTWDSNLLLLLTAVLTAVSCVRILAGKSDAVPFPLRFLRYVSTCCTALTFLVVLLILAPMLGPSGFSRVDQQPGAAILAEQHVTAGSGKQRAKIHFH